MAFDPIVFPGREGARVVQTSIKLSSNMLSIPSKDESRDFAALASIHLCRAGNSSIMKDIYVGCSFETRSV